MSLEEAALTRFGLCKGSVALLSHDGGTAIAMIQDWGLLR